MLPTRLFPSSCTKIEAHPSQGREEIKCQSCEGMKEFVCQSFSLGVLVRHVWITINHLPLRRWLDFANNANNVTSDLAEEYIVQKMTSCSESFLCVGNSTKTIRS